MNNDPTDYLSSLINFQCIQHTENVIFLHWNHMNLSAFLDILQESK